MLEIEQVRRIVVIGAGTMGHEIALQCALHGYTVTLYDEAPTALTSAVQRIRAHLDQFEAVGRLSHSQAEQVLERLSTTDNPRLASDGADLVSESIPEDLRLKRQVFALFHQLCPPHTIFTTNTSSFVPSKLASASGRPALFAALHFHPHVWEANIVDIMPHPGTDEATVQLLHTFARRIGQVPITLRRENAGYVFNAMLNGMNHAALSLAANEVASVADIDRAWIGVMGMPIGPFGIFDRVGLDTVLQITEVKARKLWFYGQLRKNVRFLEGYVKQGRLGVKSGQGFYTYPNPAFQEAGFVAAAGQALCTESVAE